MSIYFVLQQKSFQYKVDIRFKNYRSYYRGTRYN